ELALAERTRRPNQVEQFFSTHPLAEDRIRDMLERIPDVGQPSPARPTDPTPLREIQARLMDS
ncbi:MAG: hypothetical protein OES57_14000, partial [Acidimicrobiia bacterium]|nr:hypothetical protein [Acidimicrobiia bacterium]